MWHESHHISTRTSIWRNFFAAPDGRRDSKNNPCASVVNRWRKFWWIIVLDKLFELLFAAIGLWNKGKLKEFWRFDVNRDLGPTNDWLSLIS